jgi:hypothetical protein
MLQQGRDWMPLALADMTTNCHPVHLCARRWLPSGGMPLLIAPNAGCDDVSWFVAASVLTRLQVFGRTT